MKKNLKRLANFEIDKLANSIENALTGETFDTEILQLKSKDSKRIITSGWQFDWKTEIRDISKEVYKITTVNNPDIIHGLLSIEDKGDHIFMHLVESAKYNKGKKQSLLWYSWQSGCFCL